MQTTKTLLEQMVTFFLSAFRFPGEKWWLILVAIAVGIIFGAIWLLLYRPELGRKRTYLTLAVLSAALTWTAVAFIQIPLQTWTGRGMLVFWSNETLSKWMLVAGILPILFSGIVQEAAKMVPVVINWLVHQRRLEPKYGLMAGAISGAGFGIFEAIWVHNTIFTAGWTWQLVQTGGPMALLAFWERFFAVGFHIAASALAGYGLATGRGWQFYLVAAVLHGALNYSVALMQKGILNTIGVEIYVAVFAVIVTVVVLRLRYRRASEETSSFPNPV